MPDSLEQLSKSQLFDPQGQVIDETVKIAGAKVTSIDAFEGRENTVVDHKYRIVSLLGSGGMGAVYKAHHLLLDKEVALKTFKSSNIGEESWQRFQREAKAISRLAHKNIVQVFDFGFGENNIPYYTMECLAGQSLADKIAASGPLSLDQTVNIFLQICDGLSLAHSKGVIHRDLKPANIFLASEAGTSAVSTTVKIVDFGLAGLAVNTLEQQRLTATGTIFGSPLYMSPEQSLGQEMTACSDIYSLGCALFETITGVPPFRGDNAFATMLKHQQAELPDLTDVYPHKKYPQRMQGLLAKMMAKNPENRYQSLAEVAQELQQILEISTSVQGQATVRGQTRTLAQNNLKSNYNADGQKRYSASRLPQTGITMTIIAALFVSVAGVCFFSLRKNKQAETARNSEISRQLGSSKLAESSSNIRHYLQSKDCAVGQTRVFLFPTDISLGELRTFDKYGQMIGEPSQATGKKVVAAGLDLELHADLSVAERPELLSGFAPDALQSLVLPDGYVWQNNVVDEIAKIKLLKSLDIQNTAITSDAIDRLNELSNLKLLKIGKTAINEEALARLKILPGLSRFSAEDIHPISKALEKLKGSKKLTDLFISGCDLKDSDMKIISTMTNLTALEVSDNEQISDNGLRAISNLKKLRWLGVYDTHLTAACKTVLQNLPALSDLRIDPRLSTAADLVKLLPSCKISAGKHTRNDHEGARIDLVGTPSYRIKTSDLDPSVRSGFLFPNNRSLGLLAWKRQIGKKTIDTSTQAKGRVFYPTHELLSLLANKTMADDPALFYGFAPNDIFSLQLLRECGWGDRQMMYVSRLSGLVVLNLSESSVSDKSISDLNKFTELLALECEKTQLSGTGLASLYRLNKLKSLDVSHMTTFAKCLPVLAGSEALQDLRINACNITDGDLRSLVDMPNLNSLNIAENPKITNQALILLRRVKKLEALNITRTSINADAIQQLQTLPRLKRLTMDFEGWSKSDVERLYKTLNKVKIEKARDDFMARGKSLIPEEMQLFAP